MKRNVFSFLLKEAREVAVVTLAGRLFHARAAVTQKDRLIMVKTDRLCVVSLLPCVADCCLNHY